MLTRNTGLIGMHLCTAWLKVAIALYVVGAVVIPAGPGMVLFGTAEASERLLFPWAARAPDPF